MTKWIDCSGPDEDVVISTRIRLARNIENIPFPIALTDKSQQEVYDEINKNMNKDAYELKLMKEMADEDKYILVEKHLISPSLIESSYGGVLLNKDQSISIMINEEDHIRIQSILPGFQLNETYELADKTDDELEGNIRYSYDESLGYLTSCPTNVGTGMRASVMVHLPGITITDYVSRVFQAANQMGLAIRGIYGEGTKFLGNIYQISNQLTLGRSEKEIIENLKHVTKQIIQKEREIRKRLLTDDRIQLEDKIYRSLGILNYARVLQEVECMKLISNLRLGIFLDIIKHIDSSLINKMIIMTQTPYIKKLIHTEDINLINKKRSEIVRNLLRA
ncbi:MAG: protein arginine kinase [Anaeromicrobium sp.]|jgi:protein arginine kinase|uniref:protein arginine kinase n=1 Tax=Anaeromicrobium sp. TaxID=1929132 RepID=UPI0025D48C5D|nr:protein arginine kinase [Anaeromicrobium sp.]MCT4595388.1 protein arginine kinase [Anaeromicrobium sp.]